MEPNQIIYKIIVKDGDDEELGEFQNFRNLKFSKKLNDYGQCSFEVPINDPKTANLIALRRFTIWVYRNNDLLWSGEQATREGNLDEKGDNWATITCYDWLEQLNSRYTGEEVIFTAIDAGQIAMDLIDTTQAQTNGDFGFTEGDIEATQDRDRTYYNQNIYEAIVNLSNVINGFDFEINNSRIFNVRPFIGVDRTNEIVLEYGINIKSARITDDFSKPVNRAIVLGDSGVPADPLRVDTDDTVSQAIYKIRESLLNELMTSENETLAEKGEALNRKYNEALLKVSLDIVRSTNPTIVDFALGDIIRCKIQHGIYDIDESFRIFEWAVTYNTDNTEKLDLVMGNFYIPEIS